MHIYCHICAFESKNFNGLGKHIHFSHKEYTRESYYRQFIADSGCVICGNQTKFINLGIGLNVTCSSKCATTLQWKDQQRVEEQSKRLKENNPCKPGARRGSPNKEAYPRSSAVLKRWKDNKPPSWLGKKHKPSTIHKMSQTRIDKMLSGEIKFVASKKGRFHPLHPEKYDGDAKNIIYRSGWELRLMMSLDTHPDVISWSSEEVRIRYISPIDRRYHTYFPDFLVKRRDTRGKVGTLLIEVKPKKQTTPPQPLQRGKKPGKRYLQEVYTWGINEAKWKAAQEYCRDRGWEFVIMTEDDLGV